MTALATLEDVEKALGKKIPEGDHTRVEFIVNKLSTAFCARACQTFTIERYSHRLKVNRGHARPNRSPIHAIVSVTDDEENPISYRLVRNTIRVEPSHDFIIVTYDAGYSTIPDDVRLQIADSARRIYQIPGFARDGINQHTVSTGPFSKTFQAPAWAVGGQSLLSPDDAALADKYRPRSAGNVWRV